ncbi:MAG TPA: hypothetical protein VLA17_10855 [Candidatus Limnocylindria bacterium]|nr:hypothetical protein [Candidatus Limnocylindria bacterium]
MTKTVEIHGQRVELYSSDEGRTWSSNPRAIDAYEQREETLRQELKQKFARIDGMQEADAHNVAEFGMSVRTIGR